MDETLRTEEERKEKGKDEGRKRRKETDKRNTGNGGGWREGRTGGKERK